MSLKHAFRAGLAALFAAPVCAQAPAAFPTKQLHFIVPFPAGGTLDVLARTVANELGPALGQSVVVENRPGHRASSGRSWWRGRRPTAIPS